MIAFSDLSRAQPEGADDATGAVALAPPESVTDTESIGDEIARLAAHLNAATYQLLVLIREFDEREGWGDGFLSCAHWLSWRTGISPRPAREKVRVARALAPLGRISEAMARGTLSYSKVRALTRVATPQNEGDLLEVAEHATAAQMERLVRAWRKVDRLNDAQEEERRHQSRFLRLHPDDDGSYVIQGRLDPEVGAVLEKALEWASETLYLESSSTPIQHRLADGLGLVAERALAADSNKDKSGPVSRANRFQVVVHLGAEDLRLSSAPEARSHTAPKGMGGSAEPGRRNGGPWRESYLGTAGTLDSLPEETSRRLCCDSGLVVMTHDSGSGVMDVGRRSRTVPSQIRRALDYRDKGCLFPGCECRYADAHHIRPWAHGGETKLENLVLLCTRHHRALHEGGFQVQADPGGVGFRFATPEGIAIPSVPQGPAETADSVAEIARRNAQVGVVPDPWTATPLWHGESLDLSLAIDMFVTGDEEWKADSSLEPSPLTPTPRAEPDWVS